MRMAIADRTGPDTSPLELNLEKTAWDRLPPLGTWVCAIGKSGWRYFGQVASTDEAKRTYTIEVVTASNKVLDNLKNYSQGRPA